MDGVAGPVFIGANVEELEKLAGLMKRASELAERIGNSLTSMINELKFFGRYGQEFASLITSVTTPIIKKIVGALAKVGDELRAAAQKQRQVSEGTGKPTPAGVDKSTKQATNAPAQGSKASTPTAAGAKTKQDPPTKLGGQDPARAHNEKESYGRYVDYPDGSRKDGGDRAWRNNNPGNIVWNDGDKFAKDHGAIGRDFKDQYGNYMAVFPTMEAGKAAQEALLKDKYATSTIRQMVERYAPKSQNDVEAYVKAITSGAGVSEGTVINKLDDAQFHKLVEAMRIHEGQKAGTVIPPGGQK